MRRSSSAATTPERRLLWTWTSSVTAGEFAGFCAPALTAALVVNRDAALVLPAMVAAGLFEGAILGWSQARVLRQRLPRLSTRRWVINTALAAALAWFLGMLPSTFHDSWSRWPVPVQLVVAAGLGMVLLCSIGVAQSLELRRHLPRPGRWVVATAVGWCIGLLAFFMVSSPLWHPGQHPALIAGIAALGGLAMAVTMAMTTGLALIRLVGHDLSIDDS